MSNPERLAYWYFRLNGFFVLENFIVHDEVHANQRTDADLIGIRFQHRRENKTRPMQDDISIVDPVRFVQVVIVEVKKSQCRLNGPWSRQGDENVQRVLRAIGCFPESEIQEAAIEIYERGKYEGVTTLCELIAVGDSKSTLPIPDVKQLLFEDMLKFIYKRFLDYKPQKSSVQNWATDGQELKRMASECSSPEDFQRTARQFFNLRDSRETKTPLEPMRYRLEVGDE